MAAEKASLSREQIARLRDLARRKGTRAARGLLKQLTGRWWKGEEIRRLLGLEFDSGALLAQQAHRDAWASCGWRAGRWWTRPA
ncbi:MAG: hypothetical protein AB1446_07785 [Bacillota bacterium]